MTDAPRLLDVQATAFYLGGLSVASVRGLVMQGHLCPVRLPSARRLGGANRRLLFAREDLDAVIDKWKHGSTPEPHPQLSAAAVKGWRKSPNRTKGAAA